MMDTHGHAQLNRDRDTTYEIIASSSLSSSLQVKGLVCSVEPPDFEATLDYAKESDSILPALGVHPWYIECLQTYWNGHGANDPEWLTRLESLVRQHPAALVGEIGLCKMACWVRQHPGGKAEAMAMQRDVFKRQMQLAAKLRRPVSVHCVKQHGVSVSVIRELAKVGVDDETTMGLPPDIGLHSFTGTAHHVQEILNLEKVLIGETSGRGHNRDKNLMMQGGSFLLAFHMPSTTPWPHQKGLVGQDETLPGLYQ